MNDSLSNNLLPRDGEVVFHPHLFDRETSDRYFKVLMAEIAWTQRPITVYGKTFMQPRLTGWFGDENADYCYSGITYKPSAWIEPLLEIKAAIQNYSSVVFNSALVNLYRDQRDSMSWHRDNEKELGHHPTIASVSFGVTRTFQMKHRHDKSLKAAIELTHGSLLIMSGATQKNWLHGIPKRTAPLGPRINITYRFVEASQG